MRLQYFKNKATIADSFANGNISASQVTRTSYFPLGPVAQWLEQSAHNGLVPGSSPGGPTNTYWLTEVAS